MRKIIVHTISYVILLCLTSQPFFAGETYNLYFFRHAEKMKDPKKNPDLTQQGIERAAALGAYFKDVDLQQLYSTDYLRTQNTAKPVAIIKELNIESYNPRELARFSKKLLNDKNHSLIVGHSNTTPQLVTLVGGEALALTEKDYGDLTIVTIETQTQKVITKHIKINP